MGSRLNILFLLLAIALGVGYLFVTGHNVSDESRAKHYEQASAANADPQNRADVGGPFTLIDQDGKTVTNQTYRGKFLLVTFGFTYCPDICPTKLQEMSLALNGLGADAKWVQPLFISVDPERDKPSQMKNFTAQFQGNVQGLTGTLAQIADVAKKYKVYYKRTESTGDGNYAMDHSSQIFLMDQEGKFLEVFGDEADPAHITAAIRRYIPQKP